MRLVWLTDIHLNFLDDPERRQFLKAVGERSDAVAITGDIGESDEHCRLPRRDGRDFEKPIYFVLGNHDFYRSSISKTRLAVAEVGTGIRHLEYLTANGVVELTSQHGHHRSRRLGLMEGWAILIEPRSS